MRNSVTRLIISGIIVILLITGCDNSGKENYDEFGNTVSNISNGGKFCEGTDEIFFWAGNSIIFTMDKDTLEISTLCSRPECKHALYDIYCSSGRFVKNIQYYNNKLHYMDISFQGYYEKEGESCREILHTGDRNLNGSALIYNGNIYYTKANTSFSDNDMYLQDIYYRDVKGGKEKKIVCEEHIRDIIPQKELIYVLTEEYILYTVDFDGNKRALSNKKITQVIPGKNEIYYIVQGEGLFSADTDGTNEILLCEEADIFAMNDEYFYISSDGIDKSGFYVMKKGEAPVKISDEKVKAYTFSTFDKIMLTGYSFENDAVYIMNKDGSDFREMSLPQMLESYE